MRTHLERRPRALIGLCVCLASGLVAGESAAQPAVHGLELEVGEERERLLVSAEAPLEPRVIEVDERNWMLVLPGAVLDSTAPGQISPTAQGTIRRITAFESHAEGEPPEVRIVVQRRPGAPPRLEVRGSTLAIDFEPLPAAPEEPEGASIPIQYRGVPVRRILSDLARATNQSLVFDESLSGSLSIEGPARATRDEALSLIDSILLMRGFAALPSPGGVRVVVPIAGAASPWLGEAELPDSDAPVTALQRLTEVSAEDLVTVLTPYLGAHTQASAFGPTNSVILTGAASRLKRLRTMIAALDAVEPVRTLLWPLHFADAENVALRLVEILGEESVPVATADLRSNSLLLQVRAEEVGRARDIVDRLDRPALGPGSLRVLKLRYADPDAIAQLLLALRDGGGAASGSEGRVGGLAGQDFHVVVDAPTRSLLVKAAPEVFSGLIDLVRELDREPTSVRVDLMVASVTLDEGLELGIDYLIPSLTDPKTPQDLIATVSSGLGIADADYSAAFTRAPVALPILNPFTGLPLVIPRESVSLDFEGREARSEVLIRPQLLVTSGEEHRLFAGDNIPIPVSRAAEEESSTLQLSQDIQRQDVGTTVRVRPTVGAQGGVTLELGVDVTSLGASAAGDVERVGPSIQTISVESVIRLGHGEVAVLAAAQRPISRRAIVGVPWLRSLPGLGFLFRSSVETTQKRYLLITAQAEVLDSETRALAARLEQLARADSAAAPAPRPGLEAAGADPGRTR